ncbi:MAG: type II toxin-antitoxin system VapC family toxin [Bacillota bacterium]
MSSAAYCLDSSVLVKILVPEEGSDVATAVLRQAIESGCRVIAPAFAWAEVGTTLRKKIKAGLITPAEAGTAWARFMSLDIEYLNDPVIREMAWLLS